MTHLHTKSHLLHSSGSSVLAINPKAKHVRTAHVLSLYILQQHFTTLTMSNVSRSHHFRLAKLSVTPASHIRASAILLLATTANYMGCGVSSSGSVQIKFRERRSNVGQRWTEGHAGTAQPTPPYTFLLSK